MPYLRSQKALRPAFYVLPLDGYQRSVNAICSLDESEDIISPQDINHEFCLMLNDLYAFKDLDYVLSIYSTVRRYVTVYGLEYHPCESEMITRVGDFLNVQVSEVFRKLIQLGLLNGTDFPYVVDDVYGSTLRLIRKDLFLKKANEELNYGHIS